MIKKIYSYLLIITLLLIVAPLISFAQDYPTASYLEMSIKPENPEPMQNVQISIKSYTYDLDRSQITWIINGVEKRTETGLKDLNISSGKNGQKTTIKVRVVTQNGEETEIEAFFIPSVVDLIYETLAYTPPFYKGRALNPNQGVVLVTAIPELIKPTGEKVSAQNVIYSWKKNGKVQQSDSGIGKNVFVFNGDVPIRDTAIEVTASSLDGDITASKEINIKNYSPKIVFYENNPIYGIMLNKAINNTVRMLSDEFSLVAIPYHFSIGYANSPDIDYTWNMNGKTVGNQTFKNTFTARIEGDTAGTASIGLKISNNTRIFQFTEDKFNINFNKQ